MTVLKKTKTARYYDPLNLNDRWRARIDGYTSTTLECPFYDQQRPHRCELTEEMHRIKDCSGKCFNYGFCCQIIHQAVERNDLSLKNEAKIYYDRGYSK